MNTSESGITQGDRLNAIKASRRIQNLTNSSHKQVTPIATTMNNNFSYETTTYPAASSSNYNNHVNTGTISTAASYTMNTSVDLTNTISRGGTGAHTRRSAALLANQTNSSSSPSSNVRVTPPIQTNSLPKGSKSSTTRQSHTTTPTMSVNIINTNVSVNTSSSTNTTSNYLPSSSGLTTVTIGQTISNPNATNSYRRTTRSITNALANNNNSGNNLYTSPTMITTTVPASNTKRYF
jgi:hypothetical protein